jgi:hypothetical protein
MILKHTAVILLAASAFLPMTISPVQAKSRAVVIVQDTLAVPGRTVLLEARLISRGSPFMHGPLTGERLEFFVKGKSVGVALTDGNGLAAREFKPRQAGRYPVTVRLRETAQYESSEGTGLVSVDARRRPLLIVEVEAVQEPARSTRNPFEKQGSPELLPDAAEVLNRWVATYHLIYIRSADLLARPQMLDWLRDQKLPEAPLFMLAHPHRQLEAWLAQLKEEGWRTAHAVTRDPLHADLYREHGARPILLMDPDEADEPNDVEALKATDWKQIQKQIQKTDR